MSCSSIIYTIRSSPCIFFFFPSKIFIVYLYHFSYNRRLSQYFPFFFLFHLTINLVCQIPTLTLLKIIIYIYSSSKIYNNLSLSYLCKSLLSLAISAVSNFIISACPYLTAMFKFRLIYMIPPPSVKIRSIYLAQKWSGDSSYLLVIASDAPWSSNNLTMSSFPLATAMKSGVLSALSPIPKLQLFGF